MAWVLVKPGQRLFTDLNVVFPNRDRRTDGTIGDAAHEAQVSGHNPDDTSGVTAEYSDPDSKAEVRADDVDVDLNDPRGVTLQQVLDRMISRNSLGQFVYPDDVKRLKYIIHRGRIASRNNGWVWKARSPADHFDHGHFSFDPVFDEDGSPWLSVLSFRQGVSSMATAGELAAMTASEALYKINNYADSYQAVSTPYPAGTPTVTVPNRFKGIESKIDEIKTAVTAPPPVIIQPTDTQWQAFMDLVETTLATKVGVAAKVAVRELLVSSKTAELINLNGGVLPTPTP